MTISADTCPRSSLSRHAAKSRSAEPLLEHAGEREVTLAHDRRAARDLAGELAVLARRDDLMARLLVRQDARLDVAIGAVDRQRLERRERRHLVRIDQRRGDV